MVCDESRLCYRPPTRAGRTVDLRRRRLLRTLPPGAVGSSQHDAIFVKSGRYLAVGVPIYFKFRLIVLAVTKAKRISAQKIRRISSLNA